MILEEHFMDNFVCYKKQTEPICKVFINANTLNYIPIVHKDGTSRVQTVGKNDHPRR